MNKRWMVAALWALPAGVYACGDEVTPRGFRDEATSSGSGSAASLEQACEDYCDAVGEVDCGGQQLSAAQCRAACPYLHDQLDGLCIAEYTAVFDCAADGSFQCHGDAVVPASGCVAEAQDLFECTEDLECKRYCREVVAAGCGGVSEASCVSACRDELAAYDEAWCEREYDGILACHSEQGVECVDGAPSPAGCEEPIVEMGECLGYDDLCEGWCWVADALGCGEGCLAECRGKVENSSCGYAYESVLRCQLRADSASCEDGQLDTDEDCAHDQEWYEECLSATG